MQMSSDNLLKILEDGKTILDRTPYVNGDDFFYDYPLHYLGTVNIVKCKKYDHEFPITNKIEKEIEELLRHDNDIEEICNALKVLKIKNDEFSRNHGKNSLRYSEDVAGEYHLLIARKRALRVQKQRLYSQVSANLQAKYGVDVSKGLDCIKCIKVRNLAFLNTVDNVIQFFPQLQNTYLTRNRIPLFTYELRRFVDNFPIKKSAIEGGTCIIGVDEIYFALKYRSEQIRYFDIMTGSEEGPQNLYLPKKYDLFEVISEDKEDIIDVEILEKRSGPSLHNAVELYRLMWLAKKLGLPLVIGLPDEAYRKLLCAVAAPLKFIDGIRVKIHSMVDRIADEFLSMISEINEMMELKEIEVLHSRNERVMKLFYKHRQEIAEHVGKITNIQIKKEAIIDYNCMPAVPNFLWGATNILEVSDIMEIENLKSSIRLFPEISFGALAFPYIPDIKNASSMYHGKSENKIYIPEHFFRDITSNNILRNLNDTILSQVPWL